MFNKIILSLVICCFVNPLFSEEDLTSEVVKTICSPTECYKVKRVLGAGAFGKVYEVENSAGERFAIKSYHSREDDVNAIMNLLGDTQREYQLGQMLNHPNIIKSYDLFESNLSDETPTSFLVLQLVEGMPLYENSRGLLTPEEAAKAGKSLCSALEYAFSMGYLNLDLHSANIMLNDQHDLMLIDLASFFTFEEIESFFIKPSTPLDSTVSKAPSISLPAREAKIKAFFDKHPKLKNRMRHLAKSPKDASSKKTSSKLLNIRFSICFDQMTDICISLLSKTTLPREEKLNKLAEIKKVSWEYREDLDEEIVIDFRTYVSRLLDQLNSS
ncbi:MAG: protein kinase [Chlamydiia bacterium]|nr:protein kinase [Chlamydiia bacterium]